LHHLTDDEKLRLISELTKLLNKDGKFFIADIGFANSKDMEKCKEAFSDEWDDEYYFVISDLLPRLDNLYSYQQFSHCGVLLEFSCGSSAISGG
jgi:cyclopropane fatty-acyl-phospholipid synthase-like methyltransferase